MTSEAAAKDFPLLNECVAQGDAWSLFPLLKEWDRAKLAALLKEIDRAEDVTLKAWKREAFKPINFMFRSNSNALDKAKFDACCMLAEICSVVSFYLDHEQTPCVGQVPRED